MLATLKFPRSPEVTNAIAAWTLITVGVAGFVSSFFTRQYLGLPFPYLAIHRPDFELRLGIVALAIVFLGISLMRHAAWARLTAVVGSWITFLIILTLLVTRIIGGMGAQLLVEEQLDVIWLAVFFWVARILERRDVVALSIPRAEPMTARATH